MIETPSLCPICDGTTSVPFLHKNGYTLARCANCSLMYVAPMPSETLLQAHYQNPDYFKGDESLGYLNYDDMHKALAPHFNRRLRALQRNFPKPGRLLDYGCADGYFLEMARAQGWQISGVELARQMAQPAEQRLGITIPASLN